MGESTDRKSQAATGWTEAEIRTLMQEHGILLRTVARLQQEIGRLMQEAAGGKPAAGSAQ